MILRKNMQIFHAFILLSLPFTLCFLFQDHWLKLFLYSFLSITVWFFNFYRRNQNVGFQEEFNCKSYWPLGPTYCKIFGQYNVKWFSKNIFIILMSSQKIKNGFWFFSQVTCGGQSCLSKFIPFCFSCCGNSWKIWPQNLSLGKAGSRTSNLTSGPWYRLTSSSSGGSVGWISSLQQSSLFLWLSRK